MANLTQDRADKLQTILSKRFGRILSNEELELSYKNLIEFIIALVDLVPDDKIAPQINESKNKNSPLAI